MNPLRWPTLRYGTNLIEFDAEIDANNQYGSVKAQAWDPAGQALLEAESNDPGWTTPGDLDPAEFGIPLLHPCARPAG